VLCCVVLCCGMEVEVDGVDSVLEVNSAKCTLGCLRPLRGSLRAVGGLA
jgi:hypothetical protein